MFDIALYIFATIIPIFFLMPWGLNMAQGFAFVFGVWALLGISFLSVRQRNYNTKFLGLIILLALFNLFLHTFKFSLGRGTTASFINFCIMSEGFIYILCGCLLYWLIVNYKNRFNIQYPILIINILNLIFVIFQTSSIKLIFSKVPSICGLMGSQSQLAVFSALSAPLLLGFKFKRYGIPVILIPLAVLLISKSNTGLFALFLVTSYYFYKTNEVRFWLLNMLTLVYTITHIQTLVVRFSVRLESWAITLGEIFKSPIFGHGFDNTLNDNKVWNYYAGGLAYRHNDLLNITRDLGLVFSSILVIFIVLILKNMKKDFVRMSILVILISSLFQTSLYFPRIAIFLIVLLALKQAEKLDDTSRDLPTLSK